MALTIYGSPRSRTMRTLWCAEELELEYTHLPLEFDDPVLKEPEFLAINPGGTVPTITDGDFSLSESSAINLYLAKKYGSEGPLPLYPSSLPHEANVWRWSLWAQGHIEPWVQKDAALKDLPKDEGGPIHNALNTSLQTLNRALEDRDWLCCDYFTVGDLNVAGILSPSRANELDLGPWSNIRNWLERCYARPAALATRARFSS